jgi:hypothetical protein
MSVPQSDRGANGGFSESVDWADGRVATRGRLTSAAADLLGGTAEQLRRAGHAHITVELHAAEPTDDAGLAALRAVAADLRVRHCELVVLWEEKEKLL